ncbi:GNAT family N-acetyltransferase [Oerskovia flava]|uniref:GNAT family N-acetyltransferase n=1 Tax=Oerskovia flava TaxID=2986422 RepID=UPI002240C824|nr:GNAT family N-acetyltransferase [Oerskovia sp. JB1-3-2]
MTLSTTPSPTIRPARTDDTAEVDRLYDICLRTGDSGQDASGQYSDPRLIGEIYLGAYLALEPDLAFVLDDGTGPVGYVVGTQDTAAFEARCAREWWPPLRQRYPRGAFAEGSPDAQLVGQVHAPRTTDRSIATAYPAHLHVDLLPQAQGGGNGRRLLQTLFDALRARGVSGLHLGVAPGNTAAIGFYRHLGFTELDTPDGGLVLGLRL